MTLLRNIATGIGLIASVSITGVQNSDPSVASDRGQQSSAPRVPPPPIPYGHNALPPEKRWDDPELHRQWRAIVEPDYALGRPIRDATIEAERQIDAVNSHRTPFGRTGEYITLVCASLDAVSRVQALHSRKDDFHARLQGLALRYADSMSDHDANQMGFELMNSTRSMQGRYAEFRRLADRANFAVSSECQVLEWQRLRLEREAEEQSAEPQPPR